ncbi:MAG: MotA/TolQ/ExbB proton channel family protein, partial [bacterium]
MRMRKSLTKWFLGVALSGGLVLGWTAGIARAAPAAAPAISAIAAPAVPVVVESEHLTMGVIFEKGGIVMWVLLLLSMGSVAIVIYDAVTLRKDQVLPTTLRDDVMGKLQQGQWEDARLACSYRPCAFAAVTLAALDLAEAQGHKPDPMLLKGAIEGEGARQGTTLQEQPQVLLDIAVIAPMIGLLGSIFGMLAAFRAVAMDAAKAKPMLLAAGVSEAMFTTAGGLIVGILAMAFYGFYRRRAARLVGDL